MASASVGQSRSRAGQHASKAPAPVDPESCLRSEALSAEEVSSAATATAATVNQPAASSSTTGRDKFVAHEYSAQTADEARQ